MEAAEIREQLAKVPAWLVVLILAGLYCLYVLATHSWDPMTFVVIGREYDPAHGIANMGYDGQFAYQIAINPGDAASFLDIPAYRYQRILYPLLARLLSLGNDAVVPWMMITINLASLALGTLATEKILADHGQSRWYALTFGLFTGQMLSLRLDLTEPMAFMLTQWGVLLFDRKRLGWSGLLFALAALTRELTLLFPAACVLALLTENRKIRGIVWGTTVLMPFMLWQVALRLWLGEWGIGSGGARASSFEIIPFKGWWGYHTEATMVFVLFSLFVLAVALVPSTAGIITAVKGLWRRHFGVGVWILLLNSLIFPFLPTSNVLNPPGLVRMVIGLVAATLDYGALERSKTALRFSVLWLFLLAFGEGLVAIY